MEDPEEATPSGQIQVRHVHDGAVYPDGGIPVWLLGVVDLDIVYRYLATPWTV